MTDKTENDSKILGYMDKPLALEKLSDPTDRLQKAIEKIGESADKLGKAIEFCTSLEKRLRPFGMHVALTGSTLYGMGTGKDIDIAIYAHAKREINITDHALVAHYLGELIGAKKDIHASTESEEYSHGRRIEVYSETNIGRVDVFYFRNVQK